MKKLLLPAILLLISTLTVAQSGEKNFLDQPYIEVTGTAEMSITPDLIYLKIIISEADTKGKISLETLEKKMKDRLTNLGIDVTTDLTVEDFSSSFISYFLKHKDVITSREYVLVVHSAAMAGKAIEAISEENISNISLLKVDHSQMAQKRFELRLNAVSTAKQKASAMAETLGQTIGKALFVSEDQGYNTFVQSNSLLFAEQGFNKSRYEDAELSFKKITIKSSVLIRFALQ